MAKKGYASTMAKGKPLRGLKRLHKSPPYIIGKSAIDWYHFPQRAKIANNLLWLRFSERDAPVKAAFDYFGLNHSNPNHWRVLIEYLASVSFPDGEVPINREAGAPKGPRKLQRNADVLARCRMPEFSGKNDSYIAKKLIPEFPKPNGMPHSEAHFRKLLREARLDEKRLLKYLSK